MKIAIHAGMHKTGTSSFQENLRRMNAPGVRSFGPEAKEFFSGGFLNKSWISAKIQEAEQDGVEVLVFSHEGLSVAPPSDLKVFTENHDPRFVITFRHWCGYLHSRWVQNAKMRDAESFCSFMTRIDDNTPQRAWIEFDKVIVAAEEAGFNDIVPISFDKVVSDGGIIAALSEACGVPDGGETRVNTSSVKVDIDMLRLFNGIRGGGVADALSPMRVRLGNGGARPRIFAQTPIVGGLLLRNPILAEKLRSMLDNTRAEVTLDPSMFGGWQSHFERSIARYCNDHSAFFGEVKAVTRTYSTLEIEDIPESLRKEMRTALWREILRVRVVRSRWLGRLRRVAFRLMPSYS